MWDPSALEADPEKRQLHKGHRFKISSLCTYIPLGNISAQYHRLRSYSYRIIAGRILYRWMEALAMTIPLAEG